MNKLFVFSMIAGWFMPAQTMAQTFAPAQKTAIETVLRQFTPGFSTGRVNVDSAQVDGNRLVIYASTGFSYISFNQAKCDAIISGVKAALPDLYKNNEVRIITGGVDIHDLIPRYLRPKADKPAVFTQDKAVPLVRNLSRPDMPTNGLYGRHIAMWQSHGLYFEPGRQRWQWQRGRMFQTVEDKYTQQYVLPYLIPMLEKAGAYVLTPRERDTNPYEVVVDNDGKLASSPYQETNGDKLWTTGNGPGFAYVRQEYKNFENPFRDGTYRMAETTSNKNRAGEIKWTPRIIVGRPYAVYVAYQSLPNSTTQALYTVNHKGGSTHFSVNQQMGGGTWIYLGTFEFDEGTQGNVTLSNYSKEKGTVVTADAVRFGGGMGNIARRADGDSIAYNGKMDRQSGYRARNAWQPQLNYPYETSGYPRYLEGARYYMQWAGIPDSIYSPSHGNDDYRDDYKNRGPWVNYLLGGTKAWPEGKGLRIPIDLSFAFHSDAGTVYGDSIIGTLGIYMVNRYGGKFADGTSRQINHDLCDLVQSQIVNDIRTLYEPKWTRRGMWNQSYFEAWTPRVPAMLLELLSHENFADMRYGADPRFQFSVARAIYKGMLRFLSDNYGTDYVVQPLPVKDFALQLTKNNKVMLTWQPVDDPLEATAKAEKYIVYTRLGDGGWDNGVVVKKPQYTATIAPDQVVSFKVCALNKGGESFPSEILSVGIASTTTAKPVLVVNGFDRISAPDDFRSADDEQAGFLADDDNGVPYHEMISYTGKMKEFRRAIPWTDDDASGYGDSQSNYERIVVKGNTFDYPALHGRSILKAGYSFISVSRDAAVDLQLFDSEKFSAVDLILGKNKQTKMGRIGAIKGLDFKTFPKPLQQAITTYCQAGGRIFVSGSYVATDLWQNPIVKADKEDIAFARGILKYQWRNDKASTEGEITAVVSPLTDKRLRMEYFNRPNEQSYVVESPDAIDPADSCAYTAFRYPENNKSAGIVFGGNETDRWRTVVLGFPFEAVKSEALRDEMMKMIMSFLITQGR